MKNPLPYSYIVFDIDGTLIPKARTADESEDLQAILPLIEEKDIDAFKALVDLCAEHEINLIIATGRPPDFAKRVNDLLFAGRAHAIICSQGWETVMKSEKRYHPLGDENWLLKVAEINKRMLEIKLPEDFVYNNDFSCGIVSKERDRLYDYRNLLVPLSGEGLVFGIMSETVYVTHEKVTKLSALLEIIGNNNFAFIGDSMNDYIAMIHEQCTRIGFPSNVDETLKSKISQRHFREDGGQYFPSDKRWFSKHENENLSGTNDLLRRMLRQDLGITC